jgi:hypothetical protein
MSDRYPTAGGDVDPGSGVKHRTLPWIGVAIIFALSAWGVGFDNTCQSDGCMGIIFPIVGLLIALGLQGLVVIPFVAIRRWRAGQPVATATLQWILASVAAAALPLLFLK